MGRRDDIVAAAVEVFGRHGFRHTSMDLVARAAGVSRPALYQYFRNKQDVFAAVTEHTAARLPAAARRAREAEGDLADRVHGVLRVELDAGGGESWGAQARHRQEPVADAPVGTGRADDRLVDVLARLPAEESAAPDPRETAVALLASTAGIGRSEGAPDVLRRRLRRLVGLVVADLPPADRS